MLNLACMDVCTGDMGRKTVGNDLDNAWIQFDHVTLPKSALLNRYADINGSEYEQKIKGMPGECVENYDFSLPSSPMLNSSFKLAN